jgi:uncharacterized protein with ParB-like and HNH nuclease domain/predicted transport protein
MTKSETSYMKATEAKLLTFLKNAPQFIIPIYQRTYSWTEKECRQLWDDVLRAGRDDKIDVHFIGSIVYIEQGLSQVVMQSPNLVIDGQQRLTTVTLLLLALAETVGDREPMPGFSGPEIRESYLTNHRRSGDDYFKLLLSETDRTTLNALVARHDPPEHASRRVLDNHALFKDLLEGGDEGVRQVCTGLSKLVMVDIALSREHDNPQLIFESMNSTGRELSQADLIRNFVLMGLELQTRLYTQHWRPMETGFGQAAYTAHFDSFMRHYLTVRTGDIPRLADVYDAYKDYARTTLAAGGSIENLVGEVRVYAKHFCAMALGRETDPLLKRAFEDLRELKVDVAYPLLLELYDDYQRGALLKDDFHEIVRLIEAYVFRRAICAIPTNSLNKTLATFARDLKKDSYLESAKAHFLLLKSYKRFPTDDEFIKNIQTRDLYNFRSRSYWLRRFENHARKEMVPVEQYTIEHILPQNENLSAKWRGDLGPDWKLVQERWLHTLGNLTLTGYNSEYSDRSFSEKRDMENGFRDSPLRVNKGLGAVEVWNEDAIRTRAAALASRAAEVWRCVHLPAETLNTYSKGAKSPSQYSIDDHPQLSGGAMRDLFDQFRTEVLALDPCVHEEFLKLYVAFKAETNFVDVVPQAKALRLSLNIDPTELADPREMVVDVTGVGRWGNGNSEVKLSTTEDIPYVIGLVRQALERQLGDGADT